MKRFFQPPLLALTALTMTALPVAIAPAAAQTRPTEHPAGAFVDDLASRAFGVLRDKSISKNEARVQFKAMLREGVAVKQVGDRLIRSFRRQITPQQYAAYSEAFPDYVVGAYADRLYEYANADFEIYRVQPAGNGFVVYSRVKQPGQSRPFDAIWSVMKIGDRYQMTNLTVAGVNLALTQEADFRSVIQRNGFDALVSFMRNKAKN